MTKKLSITQMSDGCGRSIHEDSHLHVYTYEVGQTPYIQGKGLRILIKGGHAVTVIDIRKLFGNFNLKISCQLQNNEKGCRYGTLVSTEWVSILALHSTTHKSISLDRCASFLFN